MPPIHDLGGLMSFLEIDDWGDRLGEVMDGHFGPPMLALGLDPAAIGEALGDLQARTLWGCAFEDLMTRRFEPGGRNFVDAYLKRRGWREPAAAKAYMRALKSSVMSLYETSRIVPEQSFMVRDLIRGGEPILVLERSATRSLKEWDRIAARIVPQGRQRVLSGGTLRFPLDAADALLGQLKAKIATGADLRRAAPLFTAVWLYDALPKALGRWRPTLQNTSGDELVFHDVRFPLAAGAMSDQAASRLDAQPALRRDEESSWCWLDGGAPVARLVPGNDDGTFEDSGTILGTIEIKDGAVVLSVNSAARAERGSAMLAETLGSLAGPPLTLIRTVDQMMAEPRRDVAPPPDLTPELKTTIVHGYLDKHYRETLDLPVGMLDDAPPRAAAATPDGRKKVAAWLKFLENSSLSRPDPGDPLATYDFRWMWLELKVEDLRR